MCQHGHLDTSILAYLGSRGLLTHFEGNGGIFQAKQAIHRGTAMFICYLSFCGQEKEWLNRLRNDFYSFLQQNGQKWWIDGPFLFFVKYMEICFILFLFVETWANGFQPFQTKPLITQFHTALQWKELKTLRLQTRDSALALRRGFSCLCLIPSALVRVGRYGWMRYSMICSFFLWSMHMHSKLESKKLTKVLVHLHQPEFPSHFTSNLPFWLPRNWTPNLPTLHAFLPSSGGFLAAGFPSDLRSSGINA